MQIDASLIWHLISGLGNLIVTSLIVLIIAIWLLANRNLKMAVAYCALYAVAMILVLITKIAFVGWGIGIESLDFTGISGHATRAGAVFPILFYLAMQNVDRQSYGAVLGAAVAGLIAFSRVMVDAHSNSEAISGFVLGCSVSLIFIALLHQAQIPKSRWWLATCLLALLFISPFDKSINTDPMINRIALFISKHEMPITRKIWKKHIG